MAAPSLTGAQKSLLRQICQNKNACGGCSDATIIVPRELRTAQRLLALGLVVLFDADRLARPTDLALAHFPVWNPDQLTLDI